MIDAATWTEAGMAELTIASNAKRREARIPPMTAGGIHEAARSGKNTISRARSLNALGTALIVACARDDGIPNGRPTRITFVEESVIPVGTRRVRTTGSQPHRGRYFARYAMRSAPEAGSGG